MTTRQTTSARTSEAAIFGRLLSNSKGQMAPDLARYVLTLGFDAADQARMTELAARNQEGTLSLEEQDELRSYVRAGHLLALLQSKARKALKKRKVS
jgi:hypothetical protein